MCIACTYIYHISHIYDPVHHGKRSSKWTYRPTVKVAVSMASPTEVNVVLVDDDTKAKTDDSNGNDDENAGENVILITCCDVPVSCRLAVFWRSFDKPWVLSTCCLSRHGICGCPCPFDMSFLIPWIPWTVAPNSKKTRLQARRLTRLTSHIMIPPRTVRELANKPVLRTSSHQAWQL